MNKDKFVIIYNERAGKGLKLDQINQITGKAVDTLDFYFLLKQPKLLAAYEKFMVTAGDGTLFKVVSLAIQQELSEITVFPVPTGTKNVTAIQSGWVKKGNETNEECFSRVWKDISEGKYRIETREMNEVIIGESKYLFGFTAGIGAGAEGLSGVEATRDVVPDPQTREALGILGYAINILFGNETIKSETGVELFDFQVVNRDISNLAGCHVPGQGHKAVVLEKKEGFMNRVSILIRAAKDGLLMKKRKPPEEILKIQENIKEVSVTIHGALVQIDSYPLERVTGKVTFDMKAGHPYSIAVSSITGSNQEESSVEVAT